MAFTKPLLAVALALVCAAPALAQTWQPVGGTVTLSASTTSTTAQLGWVGNTKTPPPNAVVCNSGSADAYVALGASSLAVSARRPPEYGTVLGASIPAGGCRSFQVNSATTVAAVTASGSTSLAVQTGIGTPVGSIGGGAGTPGGSAGDLQKNNGLGGFAAAQAGNDYAKVATTACSGTDKVSAINATTGAVTCSADQGGGGSSPGGITGDLQTNAGGGAFGALTPGAGIATWLATPSSANFAAALTDETGTGAAVFANSPTLVTPNLGTPSALTLTNATGLPIGTGVSGLGTGVATALATMSSANLRAAVTDETGTGLLYFQGGALGTPVSVTLTNATGLPIAGITGLGSGVGSFLGTPSSANLLAALTTKTGTGNAVFGTAPTLSGVTLSDITGSTQCLHVNSSGALTGTGSDCGAGGGGTPGGSSGQLQYNNAGAFGGASVSTGLDMTGGTLSLTSVTNDQSGAAGGNYTVVSGDAAKTVQVAGGGTTSLPQAGSTGFGSGWSNCLLNVGSGGSTVSTSTSTFKGAGGGGSFTLRKNDWACPSSDGTNYEVAYGFSGLGLTQNALLLGGGNSAAPSAMGSLGTTTTVLHGNASGAPTFGAVALGTDVSGTLPNANLATMAAHTFKGNNTGSTAAPSDLTQAQLTAELNAVVGDSGSGGIKGLVPAPASGDAAAGRFLKADGTWAAPGGAASGIIALNTGAGATGTASPYIGVAQPSATFGATRPWVAPRAVTISGLQCWQNGGPGAGNTLSVTATVGSGGSSTGVDNTNQQVQLSGTANNSTVLTNTGIALSTGDVLGLHVQATAGSFVSSGMSCTINWN